MKKPIFAFLILGLLTIQNVAYGQCKGNLIFQDEFNGTSLDQSKWSYELGNGCPALCGWGNNEKEYYTNSTQNVNVSGGYLNINAIYNPNYSGSGSDFTSGKINTKGKFDQLYGRFEASIKLPAGTGLWPAFWMLPTDNAYGDWPTSGEIDIMEYRGDQQTTSFSTMHYGNAWPNNEYDGTTYNLPSGNFTNAFHEFAVEWQPRVLKFYVDNVLIKTETQNPASLNPASNNAVAWPWDKRYYIILNLALGGWFSGNPSTQDIINSASYPQSMQVDYVRVYDMAPGGSQSAYNGVAIALPGKLEAENYNIGCEGSAYHDADASNNGGAYRTDAVDIEACTDAGGGYDVSWTEAGEWMNYNVNVTATAVYKISARMASLPGNKNFHLELDGVNISGSMTVPATSAWSTYQTITVNNVTITSGNKVLKIVFDDGDVNCNWIQFDQLINTPPLVSITAPVNNASYLAPASITFTANATDSDGSISKVEYYNGTNLLGTVASGSAYSYNWANVAAGTYTITAKAYDNLNAVTTSSAITVKVNTNQAPVISITAPVNNAAYMAPASVTFTATATDSDGSISKVEYYNGTTLLGTVTSGSAYSYNWTNVAAGTYTITAKSYDNLNAVTTSSAITVKVTANQSPTVSITSPVTNANVGINESITIHADASDSDGSVVKVEFFNGSTKIGESDRAPYTLAWSASNAGTYTIRVVATDNAGATDEDAITIHANITTGIYNARAIDLNFYPNPAKDVLYFDMAVEKVTVYSINGTIVKNISLNGMDCLTTSDLSSGMYVCEIVTKQGTAFIKILKE